MFAHGPTWDEDKKQHKCCGSKHSYHNSSCPERSKIPGRASDPDWQKVHSCKDSGLSSGECAAKLGMPLDQVNDLWLN